MLVKQLEQEEQKANQGIQEFLVDLGRRHFSYGSNTAHMELLGRVFVESLQPVFADDLERENIQKVNMQPEIFVILTAVLSLGLDLVFQSHRVLAPDRISVCPDQRQCLKGSDCAASSLGS